MLEGPAMLLLLLLLLLLCISPQVSVRYLHAMMALALAPFAP